MQDRDTVRLCTWINIKDKQCGIKHEPKTGSNLQEMLEMRPQVTALKL